MNESDGVNELFDEQLRVALMLSSRLAEIGARAWQEQLIRSRAVDEAQAREAGARLAAERASARAALSAVDEPEWWSSATPEQIGAAYQTAATWKDLDPDAATAHTLIAGKLEDWGIHPGTDESAVTDVIRAREWAAEHDPALGNGYTLELMKTDDPLERDRLNEILVESYLLRPDTQQGVSAADAERAAAAERAPERREAAAAAAQEAAAAEQRQRDAEMVTARAAAGWDTGQGRRIFRDSLTGAADDDVVHARTLADASQARPATAAVQTGKKKGAVDADPAKTRTKVIFKSEGKTR